MADDLNAIPLSMVFLLAKFGSVFDTALIKLASLSHFRLLEFESIFQFLFRLSLSL
jgi:hypothetical protein